MSHKDIDAIKAQRDKTPDDILQELFDYDYYLEPKGKAYVWVDHQGTDGGSYTRSRIMTQKEFDSHETRVSQDHTNAIRVAILDMLFDPKTMKYIPEEK